MITIQRGNDISVQWTIKNISGEAVDFSGCDITFAVRSKIKGAFFVIPTSTSAGVIRANVPGNVLPVGHFYLDVEWNKTISGRKVYWRARTEELIKITDAVEDSNEAVSITADTSIITQGYVPDCSNFISKDEIVQNTGDSKEKLMSQYAVTKVLGEVDKIYLTSLDITKKENGSSISEEDKSEIENIKKESAVRPVYCTVNGGWYSIVYPDDDIWNPILRVSIGSKIYNISGISEQTKWEISIIDMSQGQVGKVDSRSDGSGEIFNSYGNNIASGKYSHAEGYNTESKNDYEHAEGIYNKSNEGASDDFKTIHSVGIGSSSFRKNAHETMKNGDLYIFGIGGYDGTNPEESKSLQEIIKNPSSFSFYKTNLFDMIKDDSGVLSGVVLEEYNRVKPFLGFSDSIVFGSISTDGPTNTGISSGDNDRITASISVILNYVEDNESGSNLSYISASWVDYDGTPRSKCIVVNHNTLQYIIKSK